MDFKNMNARKVRFYHPVSPGFPMLFSSTGWGLYRSQRRKPQAHENGMGIFLDAWGYFSNGSRL
jgi:hypothetical protein